MLILKEGENEEVHAEPLNPNKFVYVKYYKQEEITRLLKETGFKVVQLLSFIQDDSFSAGLTNKILCVIAKKG